MPGESTRFKKGNKVRLGTTNPNAGRPPNEFKQWISGLVHSPKARKRLEKIIADEADADEIVTSEGVCVPHRAKAQTYLQALELAWNYAEGKPGQSLDLNVHDESKRPSREDLEAALTILRASHSEGA